MKKVIITILNAIKAWACPKFKALQDAVDALQDVGQEAQAKAEAAQAAAKAAEIPTIDAGATGELHLMDIQESGLYHIVTGGNLVRLYGRTGAGDGTAKLLSGFATDFYAVADVIQSDSMQQVRLTDLQSRRVYNTLYSQQDDKWACGSAVQTAPNPQALTFTGAVSGTYDGSAAKTVDIPASPVPAPTGADDGKVPVARNGAYQLEMAKQDWIFLGEAEATEELGSIGFTVDQDGNPFALDRLIITGELGGSGNTGYRILAMGNRAVDYPYDGFVASITIGGFAKEKRYFYLTAYRDGDNKFRIAYYSDHLRTGYGYSWTEAFPLGEVLEGDVITAAKIVGQGVHLIPAGTKLKFYGRRAQ